MRFPLLLLFITSSLCPLKPQSVFQKTYGKTPNDYGYSVIKDFTGGYVASGMTSSYGGTNYLYLLKTDQFGDTIWVRAYAASGLINGYTLQQTNDSGYVISGNSGILKTDKNGAVQWGSNYSTVSFYSVRQTSDGGYILAGSIGNSNSSNGMDIYLLKLSSNGIKQWSKKLGGVSDDYSTCIRQTSDGGYISCGGTFSFGGGDWDIYLVRTNSTGDTLWTKTYGDAGTDGGLAGRQSLEITADGGFIIGAHTNSHGAGAMDAYLLKTDANGNVQWSKTYGGTNNEIIYSVKQTTDGGYAFTGYTSTFGAGTNDIYLVRTNSLGDTLWTRTFGGPLNEAGQGLVEADDKGFAIGAYTNDFGSGNSDLFLVKTDSFGNSSCNQFSTATKVSAVVTTTHSTSTKTIYITLNIGNLAPVSKRGGKITDACVPNAIELFSTQNILHVFPDPSDGHLFISVPKTAENFRITITDVLGNIIYQNEMKNISNETELDLDALSNGTYFLKAEAGKIYTAKIIINR